MFVFDSIFVSMFHVSMNYQLHTKYLYTLSQEHNFYLQVDSYVHVSQRRMIELGRLPNFPLNNGITYQIHINIHINKVTKIFLASSLSGNQMEIK